MHWLHTIAFTVIFPLGMAQAGIAGQYDNSSAMPEYEALIRERINTFHDNYNENKQEANIPLFAPDIDWLNDNVPAIGRAVAIRRLTNPTGPFPDIQLRDRLRLIDGGAGAVLFLVQGTQEGAFGPLPPSGNKIEVLASEFVTFDEGGLASTLLTISQPDRTIRQVQGLIDITSFQDAPLISNPQTPAPYRARIRTAAATIKTLLNKVDGQEGDIAALVTENVTVNINGDVSRGRQSFVEHFETLLRALPDLLTHDNGVVADGQYVAIDFVSQGTRKGPYLSLNGTTAQPDGRTYRVRGMRFLHFDGDGLISTYWEILTQEDFLTQVVTLDV